MNRWVVVAGLGLGCLLLALLLFRPPDTGADLGDVPATVAAPPVVAPSGPAPAAPVAAIEAPAAPDDDAPEPAPGERPAVRPLGGEVSPELAAQRAWRGRPAAVYSTRVLAPFSTIRFTLMKQGGDARALADELGSGVMQDLRGVRASPEQDPLTPMLPALQAAAAKVEASEWGDDPTIRQALDKLDTQIDEFGKAMASGAPPVEDPWATEQGPGEGEP